MRANARAILVDALSDAHRWLDELLSDPLQTLESLALREGKTERSIRMTLSLAFLAPGHRQGRSRGTPAARLRSQTSRRSSDGLARPVAGARARSAGSRIGIHRPCDRLSCAVIRRDWPLAIARSQLLWNTNSGNGKLRPETLGAPRRKRSPERAKPTAETASSRTGYGNVRLFPALGNHVSSR